MSLNVTGQFSEKLFTGIWETEISVADDFAFESSVGPTILGLSWIYELGEFITIIEFFIFF